MGSSLSQALGTSNQFQASNPYSPSYLQTQLANQGQIYNEQQNLASQLQAQAAGQGPNPAQTQYMQNVQQNNQNAQGLIASQRGLNPALAAKMGANASSNSNQQAAMQGSLLQQQQQLGAQSNLGNLYGQMQQGNLGAQSAYGQQSLGTMQANAAVAAGNQNVSTGLVGGILGGVGSGLAALAHGGQVQGYADGGSVAPLPTINDGTALDYSSTSNPTKNGPMSATGKFLSGAGQGAGTGNQQLQTGMSQMGGGIGSLGKKLLRSSSKPDIPAANSLSQPELGSSSGFGGNAPSLGVMPSASNNNPSLGMDLDLGKAHGGPINFKPGGHVPGKATHTGDNLKNDTVPAMLSPGEVVVPRTVTQSQNAPEKAKAFVAAVLARHNPKRRA